MVVSVVHPPSWFVGTGVGLDLVGALILGVIAVHVLKYYFATKKYKWLRLGISFALLSATTVGQAMLSIGLTSRSWSLLEGGVIALSVHSELLRSLVAFGLIVGVEFMSLFGLYLLWTCYHEASKTVHALVSFLLLLVIYFATDTYFIFHLVALVFLALVTTALITHYRKYKRDRTKLLIAGFAVLTISRLLYIMVNFSGAWFVGASLLQVLGLILILTAFIQVVTRGKKKSA